MPDVDSLGNNEDVVSRSKRERLELGKRLRELRLERDLSQEELAHKAGLHRAHYGDIERGAHSLTALNLQKLATALGVEVGVLFPPMAVNQTEKGGKGERETSARFQTERLEGSSLISLSDPSPSISGDVHWQEKERGQPLQAAQKRKRRRRPGSGQSSGPPRKEAALVTAGVVAQMCKVNRRTVSRWVTSGVLLVAEYVEDSNGKLIAAFRREDILNAIEHHVGSRDAGGCIGCSGGANDDAEAGME